MVKALVRIFPHRHYSFIVDHMDGSSATLPVKARMLPTCPATAQQGLCQQPWRCPQEDKFCFALERSQQLKQAQRVTHPLRNPE